MKRLRWVAILGFALAAHAWAQDYPVKPVRVIVPWAPGGGADIIARLVTAKMTESLGQQFLVENKAGATGTIGTDIVAKAAPDGYTLIFTHNYIDQLQQHVEKLPYDPTKALEAIAQINYAPAAIVVRADSRFKTLKEMFDWGRKNPGKLKFGHSGNWGAFMVPGAQLLAEAGVEATFIAHKGGGPAMQALLAGDIDFTGAFPSVISAQGDKIRVLATAGDKSPYPGVPTFKELGFTSGIGEMTRVVMAPRGVPAERKQILWDAFVKLNKDKTYLSLMKQLGENTALMSGPDYEKLRAEQSAEYKKLVEKLTK